MPGGLSVHFLQELAHGIELRPKTFPISGLQSLCRDALLADRESSLRAPFSNNSCIGCQ
jgi:hypothetical protein